MTTIPFPTFGPNGIVLPTEAAILSGVQADDNAAFGGGLNLDLTTPQGQKALSQAAVMNFANGLLAYFTNQVDPAFSQGRMQDAIGRIYYMERIPATPTMVQLRCSGLTGLVIPVGSLATDGEGNIYASNASGTIDASGFVTLPFSCTKTGPIAAPANSVATIYRTIPGWDSVTNPAPGVIGRVVESQQAFEARRSASVAINSSNTNDSIRSAVLRVTGVTDCLVVDNPQGTTQTINGVALVKNSIYVCVAGGDANAVAAAILSRKPPGCNYTGSTTILVPDSSYQEPYPTYNVSFDYASPLPIFHNVQIVNSTRVPSNAVAQIQSAIMSVYAGTDAISIPPRIGADLLANRFYAAIVSLCPWAQILSLQIGLSASVFGNSVTVANNNIPVSSAANIAVSLV